MKATDWRKDLLYVAVYKHDYCDSDSLEEAVSINASVPCNRLTLGAKEWLYSDEISDLKPEDEIQITLDALVRFYRILH